MPTNFVTRDRVPKEIASMNLAAKGSGPNSVASVMQPAAVSARANGPRRRFARVMAVLVLAAGLGSCSMFDKDDTPPDVPAERLYNEFPSEIEAITDPVARRTFLKLMGASLALAGVTA